MNSLPVVDNLLPASCFIFIGLILIIFRKSAAQSRMEWNRRFRLPMINRWSAKQYEIVAIIAGIASICVGLLLLLGILPLKVSGK